MKPTKTIFVDSFKKNADLLVFVLAMQLWPFLTGTPVNFRTALTVGGVWMAARFLAPCADRIAG